MQAIPKRQANDAAYNQIFENIKNNVWEKGDKLPSEFELCETLQVSRSTVRIALQRLKALGLIEVKHGKGSYVADSKAIFEQGSVLPQLQLTQKEFSDITVLREAIEPKAIELALRNASEEMLSSVKNAYEGMIRAASEGNEQEYSRQDCLFHLSLLLASGNDLFVQIAAIFREQYFHYFQELNKFLFESTGEKTIVHFAPENPNDPHTKIYKCLCERDTEVATTALNEILQANRNRFVSNINCFPKESYDKK